MTWPLAPLRGIVYQKSHFSLPNDFSTGLAQTAEWTRQTRRKDGNCFFLSHLLTCTATDKRNANTKMRCGTSFSQPKSNCCIAYWSKEIAQTQTRMKRAGSIQQTQISPLQQPSVALMKCRTALFKCASTTRLSVNSIKHKHRSSLPRFIVLYPYFVYSSSNVNLRLSLPNRVRCHLHVHDCW